MDSVILQILILPATEEITTIPSLITTKKIMNLHHHTNESAMSENATNENVMNENAMNASNTSTTPSTADMTFLLVVTRRVNESTPPITLLLKILSMCVVSMVIPGHTVHMLSTMFRRRDTMTQCAIDSPRQNTQSTMSGPSAPTQYIPEATLVRDTPRTRIWIVGEVIVHQTTKDTIQNASIGPTIKITTIIEMTDM